jgi:hypothetical protein
VTARDDASMSERATEITIREATPDDAAEIARVHIESSRATYVGLLPEETLSEMTYRKRTVNWSRRRGARSSASRRAGRSARATPTSTASCTRSTSSPNNRGGARGGG